MPKKILDVTTLANNDACFDLQFRKDTRHERTNAPTYYRWRLQFVITGPKKNLKSMEKIKKEIGCGKIHITKNQTRFSVQKIDDIYNVVIPYFKKNRLVEKKKKNFELWQKAVDIIYRNKGKYLSKWAKNDLLSLTAIHKSTARYKNKPRGAKWRQMAEAMTKTMQV